jgi:hypothetical protein
MTQLFWSQNRIEEAFDIHRKELSSHLPYPFVVLWLMSPDKLRELTTGPGLDFYLRHFAAPTSSAALRAFLTQVEGDLAHLRNISYACQPWKVAIRQLTGEDSPFDKGIFPTGGGAAAD